MSQNMERPEGRRRQLFSSLLIGLPAVGLIFYHIVYTAGHKLFWFDEALEVLDSCGESYFSIAGHGAHNQCSPAPLYYLLQKFIVSHVGISEGILYSYRTISIVSAVLILIVVFFAFSNRIGSAWALVAVMVIINAEFFRFAAENRPYMLWMFIFAASLMVVSSLAYKPWDENSLRSKVLLLLLMISLTLVAGPGMLQAFGFLAVLTVWQGLFDLRAWIRRPVFRFQLPVAILTGTIGLFYSLKACMADSPYSGSEWDLLTTGNWRLIFGVLKLLWPLPLASCTAYTDPCGAATGASDLFVLVAVVAPFVLWKKRASLSETKKFLLAMSVTSIIQILCAVVIGILVARAHFYFIPRVFIFLIVLRAGLVVSGGYFFLSFVSEKWGTVFRPSLTKPFGTVVTVAVVLWFSASFYLTNRYAAQAAAVEKGFTWNQEGCPPGKSSLALVDAEAPSVEYKLNFIVAFDKRLRECGWVSADRPTYYVVPRYSSDDDKTYGYQITDAIAPESSILGFFHRPLFAQNKR